MSDDLGPPFDENSWADSEADTIARLPDELRAHCCRPSEPWVSEREPDGTMAPGGHDHGHTLCYILNVAADEIDRLRRQRGEYADLETLYHRALAEKDKLWGDVARLNQVWLNATAEIEELKQWMSDACELLHDLPDVGESGEQSMARYDLLRRAENP